MKLALCMIVKNEENVLARCLDSVKSIVDEIIIVDTGSTDNTKEIASKYGKVYDFIWIDDFSAARNFSFSKATADHILWLDADDVVLPEDAQKIRALDLNGIGCVKIKYQYSDNTTFYRERIVSKEARWVEPIHEYIITSGKSITLDAKITHLREIIKTGRNLNILKKQSNLSSRGMYYLAREYRDNGFKQEAIEQYIKYLSGEGWEEDKKQACLDLAWLCPEKKFTYLLMSLTYGQPKSEVCCLLGDCFQEQKNYAAAVHWYKQALQVINNGIVNEDYSRYYPFAQLCIVYWALGDKETAKMCNEQALAAKPNSKEAINNKKFFEV